MWSRLLIRSADSRRTCRFRQGPLVVRLNAAKCAAGDQGGRDEVPAHFRPGQGSDVRGNRGGDEGREEAWNAFNRDAIEAGVLVANEALELPNTATTVRFGDGGELSVTDGPFTETKEQLGGFCLIDVASLEEALGWAKKVPLSPGSLLEVRAVKDLTPYGYDGSATPGPIEA